MTKSRNGTNTMAAKLLLSTSIPVLALCAATPAAAQQRTPGVDPECTITGDEAVCEGDLDDGISSGPATPSFGTLTVRNPDAPIAPPGYFAIGVVKDDRDITINLEDDVVINVFDDPGIPGVAQGLIAIVDNGFDLAINSGATITANGNGSFALGIEALTVNGDGNLSITNRGNIEAFTGFESALAISARQQNSTGDITITNSGELTATSGGTGERTLVTAGILARHDNGGGDITIANSGAIAVSSTTTDTDFNGVAAGIVTNSFVGANTTRITNSGTITSTGQAVHGIVGFTSNDSATETGFLTIINQAGGALSIDGTDNYGILAQTAGTRVNTTVDNSAQITMTNGANSNGVFVLSRAAEAGLSLNNSGNISGTGTLLRGLGVSTFAAPPGGTYDILIFNQGNITLDAAHGLGMTVFATREDTVEADVVNEGDLDLSATTNALSNAISINLNAVDASAGGAVGSSRARIVNNGAIAVGTGTGFRVSADDILIANRGALAIGTGTGILLDGFTALDLTNSAAITTTGASSDGIVADASLADDWQITVADTGSVVTSGADSVGIRISGVSDDYVEAQIQEATAATTVQKARIADQAMNAVTQFITSSVPGGGATASASGVQRLQAVPGTGTFVPQAFGTVTVNGTVRADGGAGAILGDSALRVLVEDADAVIATTGDDASAISASTSIQLIGLDGLTLTTTGDNASLVRLNGGGLGTPGDSAAFVALRNLIASTQGDGSTAFALDSDGGSSIANFEINNFADPGSSATISTMGDDAHGVRFVTPDGGSTFAGEVEFTQLSTAGDRSLGFNLDLGGTSSANLAVLDSSVTTDGTNSDAIRIGIGANSDMLLLLQRSTVATSGDGSDAIDIPQVADSSIGNVVILGSDVSTEGDDARALVYAALGGDLSSRTTFIADSTFATQGDNSTALLFGTYGNTSSSTTSIFDTVITTAGDNSRGIDHGLDGDGSAIDIVIRSTSVTTTGATNAGAMIFEGTVDPGSAFAISLADIDLSTAGTDSDGLFIGGGGFDLSVFSFDAANLDIATQGDDSRGLMVGQFLATDASTTVGALDGITVTTEGANAHGIWLGTSADGAMVGSRTTFDGANLDISTQGDGARGFFLGGLTGDMVDGYLGFVLSDSSVATSGDDATGIELFGMMGDRTDTDPDDDFTGVGFLLERISIATEGDGSAGLVFGAHGNNALVTFDLFDSTISTAGSNARGMIIPAMGDFSGTASSIENVVIETTGAENSGALYIGGIGVNSGQSLELFNLDLSTHGANSDALFMEGLSGENSVFTTDILNLTLSTKGENSRGLYIEHWQPGPDTSSIGSLRNVAVTTEGDGAHGVWIGSSISGDSVSSTASFAAEGLAIATLGDGARGFYFAGLPGGLTFDGITDQSSVNLLLTDMEISTAGDDAVALEAFGVGTELDGTAINLLSEGIDITTAGERSHGFVVGALPEVGMAETSTTTLAINFGRIAVSGADADAIRIGAGWGSEGTDSDRPNDENSRLAVLEISDEVFATGMNGNGLVTDSLINIFQVSENGVLTATDFAVLAQGNGGIESFENLGTITGDIRLGDEDSVLTNSGTITGNIDMGGGANAITIEEGGVLNSLNNILIGTGNAITVAGTLSPGGDGAVQTTTIGSDLIFTNTGTLAIDVSETGAADQVVINGGVTLGGATLAIREVAGSMFSATDNASFTILGNDGTDAVNGTFGTIDNGLAFLEATVSYDGGDGNDVVLQLGQVRMFPTVARTFNQTSAATGLAAFDRTVGSDADTVFTDILVSDEATALAAFDSASGEIYASLLAARADAGFSRSQRLIARTHEAAGEGWGLWGGVSGFRSDTDLDGNAADIEQGQVGFDLGMDYRGAGNGWALGAAVTYLTGEADVVGRASSADYDGWGFGAYGRIGTGNAGFSLSATIDYSDVSADVTRQVTVNTISRTAHGMVDVETFSLSGEARYGIGSGQWAFGPVVSIQYVDASLGGFAETGAKSLNLTGTGGDLDVTRYGIGLFGNWQGAGAVFDLSAQYIGGESEFAQSRNTFAGATGTPFLVRSPLVDSEGGLIAASGHYDLGGGWTIGAEGRGLFGRDREEIAGSVVVGWEF